MECNHIANLKPFLGDKGANSHLADAIDEKIRLKIS